VSLAEIKRIFDAAADLPPAEREAFLDSVCAHDDGTRAEVEELLRSSDTAPGFMSGQAIDADAHESRPPGEKPGSVIGRYTLLDMIGEGSFGIVFLAEQHEPVSRRVALKIIRLGMDTGQVIARFEAERQALAMMDHPGIARVFDAGQTDRGRPYFVMEVVDGAPITEYCETAGLTLPARLELFRQVCLAVQHAHQKGVIHRDLKPSNVLVTDTDGHPTPKIIDFGIAKATGDAVLTDKTLFTDARQFLGTPEYMSPEQAGMAPDIDTRSDIYSLGVLLYVLLTGRPPFDPRLLRTISWDEMRRVIREDEPPRPSTRLHASAEATAHTESDRRAGQIRGDLDCIVMKCLEKDRARRYETAGALAADIGRHLAGEPVLAAPPSTSYRVRKFIGRHRHGVIAAGIVGATIVIGLAGTSAGLIRAEQEADRASRERDKAELIAEFMESILDGASPWVAAGRNTELLRAMMDAAAQRIGELASSPEAELRLRLSIGNVYTELAAFSDAHRLLDCTVDLAASLHGEESAQTAKALMAHGSLAQGEWRLTDAIEAFEGALRLRRGLHAGDHENLVQSLSSVGMTHLALNGLEEAEAHCQEALDMSRRLFAGDDLRLAEAMNDVACVLRTRGSWERALAMCTDADGILRLLGPENPRVTGARLNLALCYFELGENEVALELFEEVLSERSRFLGEDHPQIAYINTLKGQCLLELDLSDLALETLQGAADSARGHFSTPNLTLMVALDSLAEALRRCGFSEDAERLALENLRVVRGHPESAGLRVDSEWRLARILVDAGRHDEAMASLRDMPAGDDPFLAIARSQMLAHVLLLLPSEEAPMLAEALMRTCAAQCEDALPVEHRMHWACHNAAGLLGEVLAAQGRFLEAEPMLLESQKALQRAPTPCRSYFPSRVSTTIINLDFRQLAIERLCLLYARWHDAEPTAGHDIQAATWRERLEATHRPTRPPDS
jgi:serine/threonine protein kinase/tetratricopeptide (TPR) repeat protein